MKLDGVRASKHIKFNIKRDIEAHPGLCHPRLDILQVGHDPASDLYVRNKMKDAEEVGIEVYLHQYKDAENLSYKLRQDISWLNEYGPCNGIMLQLPAGRLEGEELHSIVNMIDVEKDVDGMTDGADRRFNSKVGFAPCTPFGISLLLSYYNINVAGKHVVIVGRGAVGRPCVNLFLDQDAHVSVIHSKTDPIKARNLLYAADIIVFAAGRPRHWGETDIYADGGPVIIDVGLSRNHEGKLVGDFDSSFIEGTEYDQFIRYTPVPGGVGPMTRAALMCNTLTAWRRQHRLKT